MTFFRRNWGLSSYIGFCLIFGGASASGFVVNALLQLAALSIIVLILWSNRRLSHTPNAPLNVRIPFWIAGIAIAWIVVQLIPLPPSVWHALPGRSFVVYGDSLLDMKKVWRPISLQPSQTLISAMSLLPPIATLLLTLHSHAKARARAVWTIIVIGVVSSFLGILQLFQNTAQGVYFYKVTNYGASVGFFANANHLATLFLIALILSSELPFNRDKISQNKYAFWSIIKWSLVGFFAVNTIVNGSVAGIGLLIAALTYVALRSDRIRALVGNSRMVIGSIVVVVALSVGTFVWKFSGHLSTFAETSVEGEDRLEFATNTLRMIVDSFPAGYGLGSFRGVYLGYENLRTVTMTFVNHAHNDYLEFISDFGLVALVILVLYAIWFVRRVGWMWTTRVTLETYCYAAAMVIVIIASHSLVDYPLRTSAIAAIFAFATGCLAYPIVEAKRYPESRASSPSKGRQRSRISRRALR